MSGRTAAPGTSGATVKVIINLYAASEPQAELGETAAKENGLRYINIPVVFAAPSDESVEEFLKVASVPNHRPAFRHGVGAIRGSTFWMP